jgi:hypothetical protein
LLRECKENQADLKALITELTQPKNVKARAASFRVWELLWQATSIVEVVRACKEWKRLPRRYRDDMIAEVVETHSGLFISMMNDPRFPRSAWADDARIKYLAAGTAGVLMGRSPLTAIERSRKITHSEGHPFFNDGCCSCWRCVRDRRHERVVVLEGVGPPPGVERKRRSVRREDRKR